MIVGNDLITLPVWVPEYLIRDEFLDNHPAGTVNNTAATPGPGTRAVTDTESKLSVGSGVLAFAGGKTSPAWGDPRIVYDSVSRATGCCLLVSISVADSNKISAVGFSSLSAPTNQGSFDSAIYRISGTEYRTEANFLLSSRPGSFDAFIILRSSGAAYVFRDAGVWRIEWISKTGSTSTLYPSCSNYSDSFLFDYFRVTQLPAPFDSDDGLATDTHSGSVASGTTFVHEADMLLEITVATLTITNMSFSFRQASDTNRWFAYIVNNGDFYLFETVDGVSTQRAFAAGAIASGDRVVIVAEGSTIRGYSKNVLRWTYASATSHAAATTGKIMSVGNHGVFSDLKTWPRTLSGRAKQILDIASQ